MDIDLVLLEYIYQSAKIGMTSIKELCELLEDKKNVIKKDLNFTLTGYEKYEKDSKKLINKKDKKAKDAKLGSKISIQAGIKKEVKKDNSDSAIAHMIIKGLTIGIVEMESKINKYEKDVEKKILTFAKDYLKFNKQQVEKYKEYL